MVIGGIGFVIGVMITAAGLYYLCKERTEPEARKIYGVTSIIGLAVAFGSAMILYMSG